MEKALLDLALNPGFDLVGAHGTGLASDFFAIFKQGHGGDAADIVALGDGGEFLGVDFGKAHRGPELGGGLGKLGGHHTARTTPRGPEINQERELVSLAGFAHNCGVYFLDLGRVERLAAGAAFGLGGKALFGNAVDGAAAEAGEIFGGHVKGSIIFGLVHILRRRGKIQGAGVET